MPGIDQLLFGYRDGHELLAGSRALAPAQQRELLPHMDASFERADEQQLVGISARSTGGYLLARIWPAPERPRPGAVWAHGLLLSAEQLQFGHLGGLLALLRRPTDELLGGYGKKLPWPESSGVAATQPLAGVLTWAALVSDQRSRVVLWHPSSDAEHALVALLDAFPGPAREGLSFRTRERARLGDSPYRLQVASQLGGRTASATSMVIDARRPPNAPLPDWTTLIVDTEPAARRRDFLHRYGDEDARTQQQVSALAIIASSLDGDAGPDAVIQELVEHFPRPQEVLDLRIDLLGAADVAVELWDAEDDTRLGLLIEHSIHFDPGHFDISHRLTTYWQSDRGGALDLAARALHTNVDTAWRHGLIAALSSIVGPMDMSLLVASKPLFEAVLEHRPDLLGEPALWQAVSKALASRLLTTEGSRLPEADLAIALLGTPALLTLAVQTVPLQFDTAMREALRHPEKSAVRALAALPAFEGWIIDAPLASAETRRLLEWVAVERLHNRTSHGWWGIAEDLRAEPAGRLSAALLAVALDDSSADGDRLLELTFAPVHRALAEERLDDEAWSMLDPRLPRRDDWDRAGRLRRGLIKRATAGHWDAARLASTLEGAGPHGVRVADLVGGKHPLRKALDTALHGLVDIFR